MQCHVTVGGDCEMSRDCPSLSMKPLLKANELAIITCFVIIGGV